MFRASIRLLTDGTASVLFAWMLKASVIAAVTGANISAARGLQITKAVNLALTKGLPVVLATGVVMALLDARRIFRVRSAAPVPLKGAVSAAVV